MQPIVVANAFKWVHEVCAANTNKRTIYVFFDVRQTGEEDSRNIDAKATTTHKSCTVSNKYG